MRYFINLFIILLLYIVGITTAEYCSSYYNSFRTFKPGFYCPTYFDRSYEKYCCGTNTNKYCCSTKYTYYYYTGYNVVSVACGAIFGVGFLIFLIVLVICCACQSCPLYQRRTRGRVIGTNTVTGTTVVSGGGTMVSSHVGYVNGANTVVMNSGYGAPAAYPPGPGPAYGYPPGQIMQPPPYQQAYPAPPYNNAADGKY